MSLRALMLLHLNGQTNVEPDKLANGFLRKHPKASLRPLLADEFAHLVREQVRAREAAALATAASSRSPATSESVRSALGPLAELLDQPYAVGDGADRLARDLTLDEWEARKVMLQGQINGIQQSIEICDLAIAAIKKAGTSTLSEIELAAAA